MSLCMDSSPDEFWMKLGDFTGTKIKNLRYFYKIRTNGIDFWIFHKIGKMSEILDITSEIHYNSLVPTN